MRAYFYEFEPPITVMCTRPKGKVTVVDNSLPVPGEEASQIFIDVSDFVKAHERLLLLRLPFNHSKNLRSFS